MNLRIYFLLFALGLFLGAWMREVLGPERNHLDLTVDCSRAVQGI